MMATSKLYRYGNRENNWSMVWSRFIVDCAPCAQTYLHPMYNIVKVHRTAFALECCQICEMLQPRQVTAIGPLRQMTIDEYLTRQTPA